ncbi:hypothetical protein [Streptomyces clavuligerus]|uniref:Uncharacterized protein n=1 Tax=Streptomyces clavuligerus TaxID=1901 RepID=B5GN89_STRCL|nr:hypothetical protein [Streptomyces clavuligerus]EDY47785.1 hypothetical protein SSCG_00813 [Streptomyces clavuligerus]EFG04226.1 Hypothetical protein SCLAV_p0739 [Streptomyces clavuligerus]
MRDIDTALTAARAALSGDSGESPLTLPDDILEWKGNPGGSC